MVYSLPYSFGPGEVARPQEVNANFRAILNQLEDINTSKADIDLSNISEDGMENIKNSALSKNIGELVFSFIPIEDSGLHLLDGSVILSEGIYSDFCKFIRRLYYTNPDAKYFTTEQDWQDSVTTYGSCGKFVYDTENNTVRLPKISDIIQCTTDINALGDLIEAGLPNIPNHTHTTSISATRKSGSDSGGVLSNQENNDGWRTYTTSTQNYSGTDPIYGHSTTVQPQTVKAFVYIVIANSSKTDIQVDIDEIATDLNGKADTDLANVSDTGTSTGASWAMPSSKFIDLTVGANVTQYTAPANGWFTYDSYVTGDYINMLNSQNGQRVITSKVGYTDMAATIPAKAGDIVTLGYNGDWTPHSWQTHPFRFIYAQGSESEFV